MSELIGKTPTALCAHRGPEGRIGGQLKDRLPEPVQVARLEQEAGLREHDLARPVDVIADRGSADQQRLRQDAREALAKTRMDHRIDGTEEFGNAIGRHQAREDERSTDPQPIEFGDQAVAEDPVADPDEPDLRVLREDSRRDREDIVVTLQLEESSDRGERDFVVGQTELAPDVRRTRLGFRNASASIPL